jgi:hypothetical protein
MSGQPSAADLLAGNLARVLAGEPLGLSCRDLASLVHRRPGEVAAILEAHPRFVHNGGRKRGSRWRLDPEKGHGKHWEAQRLRERYGADPFLIPGLPVAGGGV